MTIQLSRTAKVARLSAMALALGAAGLAHAADPANGKTLYNDAARGSFGDSCASCHNANPGRNVSKVLNGANKSSVIAAAISAGTGGMDEFAGAFTQAELDDIAAYLGTCNATTKVCTMPVAAAQISGSATTLSFPSTAVTTSSAAQTVTISNPGTAALTLTGIAMGGTNASDFTVGGTCATSAPVAAGGSCTVTVGFSPAAVGSRSATLSVTSAVGNVSVALAGTATAAPAPLASVNTNSLSFGSVVVGASAAAQTVTVTNGGTAALSISSISTGSTEFPLSGGTCSTTGSVAVGGSCTVGVGFAPNAAGARSGTLTIANNGSGAPLTVALSGTGTAFSPVAQVAPSALSFAQTVGQATAAQTVTVSNTGTGPLTISSVSLGGAAAGDYSLASGTTCASGSTVAVNNNCVIKVVFTPSAVGSRAATVNVAHNAAGSPGTVSLNGTGNAVPLGTLTLNQSSLGFASTVVGTSSTQSVKLGNNGTAPLTLDAITVGGSNAGEFTLGGTCTIGNAIPVGSSCTADVTFKPTAVGQRSGTLTISTSDSTNPTASLSLSGVGAAVPTPAVALSGTSVDLGTVTVGQTSAAKVVTLKNSGTAALAINGIAATGGFAQTNTCGSSLAAGASCNISVTFSAAAAGAATGTLTIDTNAAGSPATVSLAATGADVVVQVPALSWASNVTSLSFPDTNVGVAAATKTLTLTNAGPGSATLTQVQKSGANAGDFTITNSTCANGGTLAVGSSCTVGVAFQPSAAGARTATLNVVSNGTGPGAVALSGNGVAVAAGAVSVAPTAINLTAGKMGVLYTPQALTISNTGTGVVKVTSITATSPLWLLGRLSPEGGTCGRLPLSLQAGQSCAFKVTAPILPKAITGKISVTTSASATPIVVPVTTTPRTRTPFTGTPSVCTHREYGRCDD